MNRYDKADEELNQLNPGYCSQILDACIRGFRFYWNAFRSSLATLMTEMPICFETK